MSRNLFFVGLIVAASGLLSPPLALGLGIAYALFFVHPYHLESRTLSKFLLQASVVGLGFGMNLGKVVQAGRAGFLYTALSISAAMFLGWAIGKLFTVSGRVSFLISAGTAICGGSAIAAVGPITEATEDEMAVSLGTVFVLNSIALVAFPPLGGRLHLSQTQFGLWAALAIHDTSSVVGAAARYGAVALTVGTTVKLARALWIVPVSIGTSLAGRSQARIQWPWFIVLFCLAAVANTYLAPVQHFAPSLKNLGMIGMTVTLFLIGTSLSKATLRQVGVRPLAQGVLLWFVVAAGSLALIRAGWVHL